jgi:hypothetical protein
MLKMVSRWDWVRIMCNGGLSGIEPQGSTSFRHSVIVCRFLSSRLMDSRRTTLYRSQYKPSVWFLVSSCPIRDIPRPLPHLPYSPFIIILTKKWLKKCKVPILKLATRHEDVLGEWRHSSTRSLTSALDGNEWWASRPGRFIPSFEYINSVIDAASWNNPTNQPPCEVWSESPSPIRKMYSTK